jgi:hypothetical protein
MFGDVGQAVLYDAIEGGLDGRRQPPFGACTWGKTGIAVFLALRYLGLEKLTFLDWPGSRLSSFPALVPGTASKSPYLL